MTVRWASCHNRFYWPPCVRLKRLRVEHTSAHRRRGRTRMVSGLDVTTRAPNVNSGAALRVLLVDDDELALAWLGGILSANEFEVCTATGSLAALASMKAAFAPVLITDLKMPGMDG